MFKTFGQSILLALISFTTYAQEDCELGRQSNFYHIIKTDHTVVIPEAKLCKPLVVTDFTATKQFNADVYQVEWSKNSHDLWYVNHYELKVDGGEVTEYPSEISFPMVVDLPPSGMNQALPEFHVRACSTLDDETICGDWATTQTQCENWCVDNSYQVPVINLFNESSTGDYSVSWTAGTFIEYELQKSINGGSFLTNYIGEDLSKSYSNEDNGLYEYQVRNRNGNIYSKFSPVEVIQVNLEIPTFDTIPSINTSGDYTVSWSAVEYDNDVVRYRLLQKAEGDDQWTRISDEKTYSYEFINQPNNITYEYKVKACRVSHNCSDFTQPISVEVELESPVINALPPQSSTGDYTVSWSAVGYADENTTYELQQQINNGPWITQFNGSSQAFEFENQTMGMVYSYQVNACRAGNNCSDFSVTESVSTSELLVGSMQVFEDVRNDTRTIIFNQNQNHDYEAVPVLGHKMFMYNQNDEVIDSRFIALDEPFILSMMSNVPTKYSISACSTDYCGEQLIVTSDQFQIGLSQVIEVDVLWSQLDTSSPKFKFSFNYPEELFLYDSPASGRPGVFVVETEFNQVSGNNLLELVDISSGSVGQGWQTGWFDYNSMLGNNYRITPCNGLMGCGPALSVVFGAPITSEDLPQPIWTVNGVRGNTAGINNYKGIELEWYFAANFTDEDIAQVDYIEVTERSPIRKEQDTFKGSSPGSIERIYYVDDIHQVLHLDRYGYGEYDFSLRACHRDRTNGDVCSVSSGEFSPQSADINMQRLDVTYTGLNPGPGFEEAGWYYEGDVVGNNIHLAWKYSESARYQPDYFLLTNFAEQTSQCHDDRTFKLNSADITQYQEGFFWTTENTCENASQGNWSIQSCVNGVGCGLTILIDTSNQEHQITPPNPVETLLNNPVIGGPGDLKTGMWMNPEQKGVGWHFYWASDLRHESSDFDKYGKTYDLIAYWMAYQQINGHWTPVWFESELKQVNGASSIGVNGGDDYFEGQLYYHKIAGLNTASESIKKVNAGSLQVLIGNTNRTAKLRMKLQYSEGMLFTPDYALTIPTNKLEGHPYTLDSADGYIEMDIDDIAVHVMQGGDLEAEPEGRFGNKNDADHFAGVYQLNPDENGFSSHTMLTSIDRSMEVTTLALFDDAGLPIWLQSESCGATNCNRTDGTFFNDYQNDLQAVVFGFDPVGRPPEGYVFSDGITQVGTLGRCFADGITSNTSSDRFKKARMSLSTDFEIIYPSTDNQQTYSRKLSHNSMFNSTDCNNSRLPELNKRASLHDIRFFVNGSDENVVSCDPNDINGPGICDIKFTWYTDDDFLSIEPYYTDDGWATSQKLSQLCPGVPTQQYVTTNFQCLISKAGNYQFQLRKNSYIELNSFDVTIAESPELLIAGCNTGHCDDANQVLPAAEAPPIQNHMDGIAVDPLNETVGVTAGAFDVDQSGSVNYTLPIYAPKGRGGLAPELALSYNSGAGNGIAGQGWNISGVSSITRCLRSKEHDPGLNQYPPVSMTWDDVFCIDGMRMFKVSETASEVEYRTEIANFSKIVALKDAAYPTGPKKFDVYTKSGEKWIYGSPNAAFKADLNLPADSANTGAQILSSDGSGTVHTWLLAQIGDSSIKSNRIRFGYYTKDGENYLGLVQWSNFGPGESPHYQIEFNYSNNVRTDAMYHYGIGTEYKSLLHLESVSTFIRPDNNAASPLEEVRRLKLQYEEPFTNDNPTGTMRLVSAEQCLNSSTCLQPVNFTWDNGNTKTGFSVNPNDNFNGNNIGALTDMGYGSYKPIDLNGDGIMEMIFVRGYDRGNFIERNLDARYWIAARKDTIALEGFFEDSSIWQWGGSGCMDLTDGDQYFDVICNTGIQPFHADEYNEYNSEMWFVYDFNSDGNQDILSTRRDGDEFTDYQIFLSNGKGICQSETQLNCSGLAPINTGIPFSRTLSGSAFLDFTADGLPDLMTFSEVSESIYQYKVFPSKVINSSHVAPSITGSYAVDLDADMLKPRDMICEGVPNSNVPGGISGRGLCVGIYGVSDEDYKTIIDKVEISPTDLNGDGVNDLLLTYTYQYLQGGLTESPTCTISTISRADGNQPIETGLPAYRARVESTDDEEISGNTPGDRSEPCEQQFKAYLVAEQQTDGQVKFNYAGRAGILKSNLIYAVACEAGDSSADCNADVSSKHDSSMIQDINGDGLGDFLYLDGSGNYNYRLNLGFTETYTYQPDTNIEYSFEKLQFSNSRIINADFIPSDQQKTCDVRDRGDDDYDACARSYLTQFIDYDLDGDLDVLLPKLISESQGSSVYYELFRYGLHDGEFGYGSPTGTTIKAFNTLSNRQPQDFNNAIWDINGDSHYDYFSLLRRQSSGDWDTNQTVKLGTNPWTTRNKITAIDHQVLNPNLESLITVDYEAATQPGSSVYTKSVGSLINLTDYGQGSPVFDINAPMYLVSQVGKTSPTASNPNNRTYMTYDYEGFKIQAGGRGSLGFAAVMSYDRYHDVITTTNYRQDFPYIGMPELTLSQHSQGELSRSHLEYTHTTFDLPQNHQSVFPYLKRSYEKSNNLNVKADKTKPEGYVLDGLFAHKVMLSDFVYSATDALHGNLTSSTSRTCVASVEQPTSNQQSDDICGEALSKLVKSSTVHNTYADVVTEDKWFLGRLESTEVTTKRKVKGTYQSNTRNSSFVYHPETGQLTQEVIEGGSDELTEGIYAGGSNQFLRNIYQYDDYGQREAAFQCSQDITEKACKTPPVSGRLTSIDSIHRYSKTTYDSEWSEYVEYETSPFTNYAEFTHSQTAQIENNDSGFTLTNGTIYEKNSSLILPDSNMQNRKRDIYGNPYLVSNMHGVLSRSVYGVFGEVHASAVETGGSSKVTKRWCEGSAATTYNCPATASTVMIEQATEKPISRKYYDVLGREIRSQVQNFNGQWQTTDTEYDLMGRTVKQSEPFTINSSNQLTSNKYWTQTQFDPMDRVVLIKSPMHLLENSPQSGAVEGQLNAQLVEVITTTDYIDLSVSTTNSKGQKTTQYFDLTGKVTQSVDHLGLVVDYVYDAQDNLKETTSYLNNNPITITINYDSLGRKSSMTDPDKGSWTYQYNALGELIEQSNANTSGWSVKNWYDIRGRLIYRMDIDGSRSIWEYDKYNTPGLLFAEHSRGRYQSEGVAQSITYDYDQFARPQSVYTQVFDEQDSTSPAISTYQSKTVYDGVGRVFQQYDNIDISFDDTQPGLQFTYNEYGYQEVIRDAEDGLEGQEYFKVLNVDQRGQVVHERHNGLFNTEREYEPRTGILKHIRTYDMFGETTQDLSFAFDEVGNLIRRTDQVIYNGGSQQAVNEIFIYDDLNRLREIYSDANRSDQTLIRKKLHTYDDTGNLELNAGWAMTYGAQGKPHAVETASHNVLGIKTYQYDANGNVENITAVDDNITTESLFTYSSFDKAIRIEAQDNISEVFYNSGRNRFIRKDREVSEDNNRVTHYLGSVEYVYEDNKPTKIKRQLGNLIIHTQDHEEIRRDWEFNFILKDHLGSTHTVVNSQGQNIQRFSFDAWGARRNPVAPSTTNIFNQIAFSNVWNSLGDQIDKTTNRGFTGHEHFDQVGIIHMNGRIYDPSIGRFLQADPIIQDPYNTQSLNRYSYVMNNPLSYTDPSGYSRLRKGWWRLPLAIAITAVSAGTANGTIFASLKLTSTQAFGVIVAGGALSGAVATGNLKGALKGAVFAAVSFGIAHGGPDKLGWVKAGNGRIVAHAMVAGISAEVDGGKFGHGFASAILGQLAGDSALSSILEHDDLFVSVVSNAILQGTISEVTGGKFANGAMSAAFRVAFNEFGRKKSSTERVAVKWKRNMTTGERQAFDEAKAKLILAVDATESGFYDESNLNRNIGTVLIKGHKHGIYNINPTNSAISPLTAEDGRMEVYTENWFPLTNSHKGVHQGIPVDYTSIDARLYPIFGVMVKTPSSAYRRSVESYRGQMENLATRANAPSFLIHRGNVHGFNPKN